MQALPPIESLDCFLAAAELLNFKKASDRVHLSPAAFGKRIRQLEEFVGIPLFTRTTRLVRLTDAGARLLPQVTSVLNSVANFPTIAHDEDAVVPCNITIGTRHELGMSWLLPLLPKLEKSTPGVRIHLHFGDSKELLRMLQNEEIDAAISSVPLVDRQFAFELLHEEHYQLVIATKLVECQPVRTLSGLVEHTLIDSQASLPLARYWLDADKERAHLQFRDLRYLGTIGAIRDVVLRGEGVAVLPSYFIQRDLKQGKLKVLFPKKKLLTDHFRLLYARKSHRAGVFSRFSQIMRDAPLK